MNTISVEATKPGRAASRLQRVLLFCGIISSILYVVINIVTPFHFPGYNAASQTVSELSAIDAPSRALWVTLCNFYSALIILFGCGILLSANSNRLLKTAAIFILIYGISGFFWPPMHLREVIAAGGGTFTDKMHIVFASGTIVLMLLIIGFAAAGLGKQFRLFSILTIIIFSVFGFLTFRESPGITSGQPTPMIGTWERINIGMFLLWIVVFAVDLLQLSKDKISN